MVAVSLCQESLYLLVAGHRHKNTVTPQPSPDLAHPEFGFWEVETASLRDFPQEFRTFDIRRNSDNTISIVTVDVDPAVVEGSPAADSRDYAIGASRIFGNTTFTNITSHAYNAELVKALTPSMQTRIANYGGPLGHRVCIERDGTGAKLTFAGKHQWADAIPGPWDEVTGATSPWREPVSEGEKFFRAVEQ